MRWTFSSGLSSRLRGLSWSCLSTSATWHTSSLSALLTPTSHHSSSSIINLVFKFIICFILIWPVRLRLATRYGYEERCRRRGIFIGHGIGAAASLHHTV
ncbi:hypothetical protein IWX48DRAFT_598867 [Phyllosticta citricarpa]